MRQRRGTIALALALLLMLVGATVASAEGLIFKASLNGAQDNTDSIGRGTAKFVVTDKGIEYQLVISSIDEVTMAHIHLAPRGSNGPIVVWLRPKAPPAEAPTGAFKGTYASGVITAKDLVGPLAGMKLDDLLKEMKAGNTYVNVHTVPHPGGEIRGQIEIR